MLESNEYINTSAENITSATFCVKEAGNSATGTVYLYPMYSNTTWTETGITWSNLGTYIGVAYDTVSIGGSQWASFDITEMLKDWKTGERNPNAGFILSASYNNTAVKALYSSEHGTTASRPYVVMTYTSDLTLSYTTASINEGSSLTLSVSSDIGNQSVSWRSSSQAVATVNNGVVTAIKAGQTVITATTSQGSSASCVVYVKIVDGVYYIKNYASSYYMSAQHGGISAGTRIVQTPKTASTSDGLWQLWKIRYLSNGQYSIRPLHKLDMGLGCSSVVSLISIGTTDTYNSLNSNAKWTISWSTNGYVFRNNGNDYLSLCTSSSWSSGAYINDAYYSGGNVFHWILENCTSSVPNQVVLYDTDSGEPVTNAIRYVKPGDTITLDALNLTASFASAYSIDQSITWSTNNPSIVSVNSSNGAVTGLAAEGSATVIVTKIYNGVSYSQYYTVHIIGANVPSYKIVHYYDLGYDLRENGALEAIQAYHDTVAVRFDRIFGIKLYTTIKAFASICDDCKMDQYQVVTISNLDSSCAHSPSCANTYNLRIKLFSQVNSGDDTTTVVLWTGHRMSDHEEDRSNSDSGTHSVVLTTYGVTAWDNATEKAKEQTFTLLHELSHQLGAPDHYCYGQGATGKCSNLSCDTCYLDYSNTRACVMGQRYDISTLSDEAMYCNDCETVIRSHLGDHH